MKFIMWLVHANESCIVVQYKMEHAMPPSCVRALSRVVAHCVSCSGNKQKEHIAKICHHIRNELNRGFHQYSWSLIIKIGLPDIKINSAILSKPTAEDLDVLMIGTANDVKKKCPTLQPEK